MAAMKAVLTASLLLAGFSAVAHAQEECKTLYEVIHNHLPDLSMSPVAAKIFDNPALKGTFLMPHGGAIYNFLADLKARGLNSKDDLDSIIGPLFLYHFMQDTILDIKDMETNTTYKTAAQFTCSTNSLAITSKNATAKATANVTFAGQAYGLGANTTILAKDPIPFCGGNVFVVDTVLQPCGDGLAFVNELRKTQPDCTVNVRKTLADNGAAAFMELLMMTGVGKDVLYLNRGYTVFAPTDNAVLGLGWDSVSLKFDSLFATNKDLLKQLLMYYIVPTGSYALADLAGKQFRTAMDNPPCQGGLLSVSADRKVVGQRFSAPVPVADVAACQATIHFIDHLVMPCCGTVEDILAGDATVSGFLDAGADLDLASFYRQITATYKAVKGGVPMNIFVPYLDAVQAFMAQAGKLTVSDVAELLMYHMTETAFDPADKSTTSLTTMLANVDAPHVCPTKTAFKLGVQSSQVQSSASLKGDPKLAGYNVVVVDGVNSGAKVLYNISGCDGNILVLDKFMLPCQVANLKAGNPMVAVGTPPTGSTTLVATKPTTTNNKVTDTAAAPAAGVATAGVSKNAAAAYGASAALGMVAAALALLL